YLHRRFPDYAWWVNRNDGEHRQTGHSKPLDDLLVSPRLCELDGRSLHLMIFYVLIRSCLQKYVHGEEVILTDG
ncbi:hypothetical protein PENTCL1PPCAC_28225, partial [Pristionchus entomophagus]